MQLLTKIAKIFQFQFHLTKKKIFKFSNKWVFKLSKEIDNSLDKLINFTGYKDKIPFKSKNYIIKRYLNHPYFVYNFHEVYRDKSFLGLVISREVKHLTGKALRIIDVLADDKDISKIINEFAITLTGSYKKCEYIDVYASNLDMKLLITGNYELISDSHEIVVPDYFSPFEKKILIYFFLTLTSNQFVYLKAMVTKIIQEQLLGKKLMSDLTIITYHYVRPIIDSKFPGIKGLEIEGFKRQLDFFRKIILLFQQNR